MRQRLIMTKGKKVVPALIKMSATPAYTVEELRDKVGEYHKVVAGNAAEGLAQRLYLNGFLSWLEDPAEFVGE